MAARQCRLRLAGTQGKRRQDIYYVMCTSHSEPRRRCAQHKAEVCATSPPLLLPQASCPQSCCNPRIQEEKRPVIKWEKGDNEECTEKESRRNRKVLKKCNVQTARDNGEYTCKM